MATYTTIENDTPILPHIIADAVIRELDVYLHNQYGETMVGTEEMANLLAARAERIYTRNQQFRKSLCGGSIAGRDRLYVFMRHWLTALLRETQPHIYNMLPPRFCVGETPKIYSLTARSASGRNEMR